MLNVLNCCEKKIFMFVLRPRWLDFQLYACTADFPIELLLSVCETMFFFFLEEEFIIFFI